MTPALVYLILSLFGVSDDPIRACYAVNDGQPWSCYLLPDAPPDHVPVYVGRESDILAAERLSTVTQPKPVTQSVKSRHDSDDDDDGDDDDNDSRQSGGMQPCAIEDGSTGPLPCYWDASKRGNGQGESFVLNENREVIYSHETGQPPEREDNPEPQRETPLDIPADQVGYHEPEATPPAELEPEPQPEVEPEVTTP